MIVYNHNVELYDCLHSHYGCLQSHNHTACSDRGPLYTPQVFFPLLHFKNFLCFFKGLTRPHHYPVMFHCIFISKQSAKFKSPRKLVCLLVLHNDHVPKVLSRQAYLGCNKRRVLS